MIRTKRVYEPAQPDDGTRFLIDRIWPRGIKKDSLKLDGWLKNVAPGDELRTWFSHDPSRWDEFRRRYFAELDSKPAGWQDIIEKAEKGDVTLLYSARDTEYNNAVALKQYLEKQLKSG